MRFNYVRSKIDGYTEIDTLGTGLNLIVDSNTRTSFTSVLGLRGSYVISTGLGVVVPQLRVEWEHEYDRVAQVSSVIFANDTAGTPLEVPFTGSNPDRDYANVGASVMMVLQGGWMPFIEYEGIFGYANLTRHRLTGGLRREF